MPTSATLADNFFAKFANGPSLYAGRLTLAQGTAALRTPFSKVYVATANAQSTPGVPTEAVIVDVYTQTGSQWVRFTLGDRDDTLHVQIWGID